MWQIIGAGDNSALYSLTQETNKGPRFIKKLWDHWGVTRCDTLWETFEKVIGIPYYFYCYIIFLVDTIVQYRNRPKRGSKKAVSFFGTIISERYFIFDKKRTFRTEWGPLDSFSILYVIEKPKLSFQKHARKAAFFETSKTFIVRMGAWVGEWVNGWVGGDQKVPRFVSF